MERITDLLGPGAIHGRKARWYKVFDWEVELSEKWVERPDKQDPTHTRIVIVEEEKEVAEFSASRHDGKGRALSDAWCDENKVDKKGVSEVLTRQGYPCFVAVKKDPKDVTYGVGSSTTVAFVQVADNTVLKLAVKSGLKQGDIIKQYIDRVAQSTRKRDEKGLLEDLVPDPLKGGGLIPFSPF